MRNKILNPSPITATTKWYYVEEYDRQNLLTGANVLELENLIVLLKHALTHANKLIIHSISSAPVAWTEN